MHCCSDDVSTLREVVEVAVLDLAVKLCEDTMVDGQAVVAPLDAAVDQAGVELPAAAQPLILRATSKDTVQHTTMKGSLSTLMPK
jgi:hypothetical protein